MINRITLDSFKGFDTLSLPLGPLTLLSGLNSGGKSSVMQAMVLLAHTLRTDEWGRALRLETPDLALGSAADVINQQSAGRRLSFGISTDKERIVWRFRAEARRALTLDLEGIERNGSPLPLTGSIRWLLPAEGAESSPVVQALRRLSWVSAERTGPRDLLPLHDPLSHAGVGPRGKFAAGLLHWHEDDRVEDTLCIEDTPPTLFHQTRAWMREFFPGCDIRVRPVEDASAVTLGLRTNPGTEFQRPQNVGFGLTQLFPLIVAMLAARPGDVLLMENPEVHLHPKAQQAIGEMIAQVAASGVQILAETHADHVLNGVRLTVKRGVVPADDVTTHFFSLGPEGRPTILSPRMDGDGRPDSWPEGFFDQFDQALAELL